MPQIWEPQNWFDRHNRRRERIGDIRQVALFIGGALAVRAVMRRFPRYDVRDKVVFITGASRGLGLVLARQLARQGAKLAICARSEDELALASNQIHTIGAQVLPIVCDVTNADEVRRTVATIEEVMGPIDILINNAGIIIAGPARDIERRDFEDTLNTHFWGPYNTVEAVLPSMRRRKTGRIVNIASVGGKVAVPHLLPYSTSKFTLIGFSDGLHSELARDGIQVTTIAPGLLRTGSHGKAIFKGHNREEYTWFTLLDTLPFISMDAEAAAGAIIRALKRGDAHLTLTIQAQVLARFSALFPNLLLRSLALLNQFLPGPGGIGTQRAYGEDSESALAPSVLTVLGERAAEKNNELLPPEG